MTAVADVKEIPGDAHSIKRPKLDHPIDMKTLLVFLAILAGGLFFAAYSISRDVADAGTAVTTWAPFLLLGVALVMVWFLVIMAAEGLHWATGGKTPELIEWQPHNPHPHGKP